MDAPSASCFLSRISGWRDRRLYPLAGGSRGGAANPVRAVAGAGGVIFYDWVGAGGAVELPGRSAPAPGGVDLRWGGPRVPFLSPTRAREALMMAGAGGAMRATGWRATAIRFQQFGEGRAGPFLPPAALDWPGGCRFLFGEFGWRRRPSYRVSVAAGGLATPR